jgi:WD40 repeat protein
MRPRHFYLLVVVASAAAAILGFRAFRPADVAPRFVSKVASFSAVDVRALEFSPDSRLLAVRTEYASIAIWDWRAERKVTTLQLPQGANDDLSSVSVQFSPDGRYLAACHTTASNRSAITIWSTQTWTHAHGIMEEGSGSGCSAIRFTPNSRYVVRVLGRPVNKPGSTVILYDTKTWNTVAQVRTSPYWIHSMAMHPDGTQIALLGTMYPASEVYNIGSDPGYESLSDLNSTSIVLLNIPSLQIASKWKAGIEASPFSRLSWHPSGMMLAYTSGHGAELFEVRSGRQLYFAAPPFGSARASLHYTRKSDYLIEVLAQPVRELRIWRADRSVLLAVEKESFEGPSAVSMDGVHVAASTDRGVIVWKIN